MHGPTFMGNPLACRVASESLELLLESDWKKTMLRLERGLKKGLSPCAEFEQVTEVRVLGGIGVVELSRPVDMARIQQRFVERGVWVRPFGKLVYLMPPYIIDDADLAFLTAAVVDVVSEEKSS